MAVDCLRLAFVIAVVMTLCSCESLLKGPPARIHVELIAPDSEVSRITTLGTLEAGDVSFISVDGTTFAPGVNYMVVSPGCRCVCVSPAPSGTGRRDIPVCFDAVAGHTYVVSVGGTGGFFSLERIVWVNKWPGALESSDLRGTLGRNPKENALFINKIDLQGQLVPGGHPQEREHCASPPTDCGFPGDR